MSDDLLHTQAKALDESAKSSFIDKMLDMTLCSICNEYMYAPVILNGCGHNFCYECISSWFNGCSNVFTCPTCRVQVETMPGLNLSIQQILNNVIESIVLFEKKSRDSNQKVTELNKKDTWKMLIKSRKEMLSKYKFDLENEQLFNGVFANSAVAMVDADDEGVIRCSSCHWELEDDETEECPHCNSRFRARHGDANRTDNRSNTGRSLHNESEYSEGEFEDLEHEMDNEREDGLRQIHDLEAVEDGEEEEEESDEEYDERGHSLARRSFQKNRNRHSKFGHSESVESDEDRDRADEGAEDEENGDYSELTGFVVDDEDSIEEEDVDDGLSSQDSDFYEFNERSPQKTLGQQQKKHHASNSDNSSDDSDEEHKFQKTKRSKKRSRVVLDEDDEDDEDNSSNSDSDLDIVRQLNK